MDIDAYLRRIGIEPDSIEGPNLGTLERLLRSHIRQVPFENLSIVGDPYGPYQGEDIELTAAYLYTKIVLEGRGGYCFELNGLFYSLLTELGYEADRIAARIVDGDDARPPANHHSIVVQLDRRYIVDVGLGIPKVRRPVPLDGEQIEMTDGDWRIVETDRPDEQYVIEARPHGMDWEPRYLFSDIPRDICYFRATNEYLQRAPGSPFTSGPIVNIATESGYLRCSTDTVEVQDGETTTEIDIDDLGWYEVLERVFKIRFETTPAVSDPTLP